MKSFIAVMLCCLIGIAFCYPFEEIDDLQANDEYRIKRSPQYKPQPPPPPPPPKFNFNPPPSPPKTRLELQGGGSGLPIRGQIDATVHRELWSSPNGRHSVNGNIGMTQNLGFPGRNPHGGIGYTFKF